MAETKIEWAETVWNPVRGCSRYSPGCGGGTPGPGEGGCYAERQAMRMSGPGGAYEGLVKMTSQGPRWTGKVRLIPEKLTEPLSWRKPRRVFVDSMSDLFHEKLSFGEIAAVVGVMAACPEHIFMTLTKRASRMREWFEWIGNTGPYPGVEAIQSAWDLAPHQAKTAPESTAWRKVWGSERPAWPLPNWHVGVSAEDQPRWDERVTELLRCPAAVRFVSAEPLLGPVSIGLPEWPFDPDPKRPGLSRLHQVIVGGESGPGSRPCRLEWIESIVEQCAEAGVACFVKQLGSLAVRDPGPMTLESDHPKWCQTGTGMIRIGARPLKSKKGGDPSEWPARPGGWPRQHAGEVGPSQNPAIRARQKEI